MARTIFMEQSAEGAGRFPSLIVLTGFRATGKTAVGRLLADQLGYRFVDTDERIIDRLGCSISESVMRNGWLPFRDLERKVLEELADAIRTVVATGGGAVLHRQSWQRLRTRGVVVWLRADLSTIEARLLRDCKTGGQRPPVLGEDSAKEIQALLAQREPLYRAGSDLEVNTVSNTPVALAESIMLQLQALSSNPEKINAP